MADYDSVNAFPSRHFLVTPHDSNNISDAPCNIYCGSAGTIMAVDVVGQALSYTVVAGEVLPVSVKRINSTGTNVTPIYGLR